MVRCQHAKTTFFLFYAKKGWFREYPKPIYKPSSIYHVFKRSIKSIMVIASISPVMQKAAR